MRHCDFVVFAFNSDLYTLLIVHHNDNLCLLSILCVSSRGVAFVMVQFIAFDLFAMTVFHVINLLFNLW